MSNNELMRFVSNVEYFTPPREPKMTHCYLRLTNGSQIIGGSEPLSLADFDEIIAKDQALNDALEKLQFSIGAV